MEPAWDVIVVGAGLAGLAAAATARQGGARVLVLEAHQAGGRARTVDRQGFTLNLGAHALYAGGAGAAVLASLGVTPTGTPPPLDRYRALASGALHLLPTGPSSLAKTRLLGARGKAQMLGLLGRMSRANPNRLHDTSLAHWLDRFHLRDDVDAVARALVRLSTYSADVEAVSAGAVVAQMQLAARGGVLYLDGGWTQLVESLRIGVEVRQGAAVTGVDSDGGPVAVHTDEGTMHARGVVVATGAPPAVARLLPADPGWGDLGPPVTAACLDLGVGRVPDPGYVLSVDDPTYVTVQSPPARQAPEGQAVVAAIRYGTRDASSDRAQLEALVAEAGVRPDEVETRRFLAEMTVAGTLPRATSGGLRGRPSVTATGVPGVAVAGDWVGPVGLLADAALASGQAAGKHAAGRLSDERSGHSGLVR